jgi:hypothetical protein
MHGALAAGCAAFILVPGAHTAQSIDRLLLARAGGRPSGPPATLLADGEERDYAAGDLNGHGLAVAVTCE